MILYHGSENIIKRPLFKGSRMGTDFGAGFYCTENINMAKAWCALRNGVYINKYKLNIDVVDIDAKYDVIIGPTADDKLYRTVQNFLDNVYSGDETLNILNCMKIDKQINIVSQEANVTGKEITKNLGTEDFLWIIDNFGILHTQDTKYVINEMERVRDIKLIDEQV